MAPVEEMVRALEELVAVPERVTMMGWLRSIVSPTGTFRRFVFARIGSS